MYFALEAYAAPIACAQGALARAWEKAEGNDSEGFGKAREEVVGLVWDHVCYAGQRVFEFDPLDGEGDGDGEIEGEVESQK